MTYDELVDTLWLLSEKRTKKAKREFKSKLDEAIAQAAEFGAIEYQKLKEEK